MKQTEQAALVYAASILASALVAKKRGKTEWKEIATDAFIHGAVVGTGVNVVLYLRQDAQNQVYIAQANGEGQDNCPPNGKLAVSGLKALSALNPEKLYKAAKMVGIHIAPEGSDPHRVLLPKE
jgi:hypothetical protein